LVFVQHDIEEVGAIGQAILLVVMLHSAFDFAITLLGIIVVVKQLPPIGDDNNNTSNNDTVDEEVAAALAVTIVTFSMLIGFVFYVCTHGVLYLTSPITMPLIRGHRGLIHGQYYGSQPTNENNTLL